MASKPVAAPRTVFQGVSKVKAGALPEPAKQADRHAQLGALLLRALAPDPLERFLAVSRLVMALSVDVLRPGQGFSDVPVALLSQHYLSRRHLADKHKGDAVQLWLQELASHEPLPFTQHAKFSAPGTRELAVVELHVRPALSVQQRKAGLLLGGSAAPASAEPYVECAMEGSGTIFLARHAEEYTFSLPALLLLAPLEEECPLELAGACNIQCLATGLTGQLRFKHGRRLKGSVSRLGASGAQLETVVLRGSWDGEVTAESVDGETAGVLFDAAQLTPPLVPAIKLGEPGPRTCPRLWSLVLEGLTCLDAKAAAKHGKKAAEMVAVLPRQLNHALLYQIEHTGRCVAHSTAGVLMQHGAEAAWVNMASLFTLAVTMGGALCYTASTMWEGLEPVVIRQGGKHSRGQEPVLLHGVDVSASRFLRRPGVLRAVAFAAEAHRGQMRKTREPYITHCIHTALIVEGLLSPTEDDERAEDAIVAALLHDVLDDTAVDEQEVELEFGEAVAAMVVRVSQLSATNQLVRRRLRLSAAEQSSEEEAQLRQMILTMVAEPLVILIKLADRLHNMRTVYALSPEKQRAVASETRTVWCSLAERLGMFALKARALGLCSELEDLCFAVLQPSEYRTLRAALDELWGIKTLSERSINPPDCCLSGECECTIGEDGAEEAEACSAFADLVPDGAASSGSSTSSNIVAWQGMPSGRKSGTSITSTPPVATVGAAGAGGRLQKEQQDLKQRTCGVITGSRPEVAPSWLAPEQQEVQQLVQSVLPFDASTLHMERLSRKNASVLEALQRCAMRLLAEIQIEGLAAGLEVYDARALRVVVSDDGGRREAEAIATCYRLLPTVHRLYRRVPGEEDDYIVQPKGSGYQSLHTAVVGPGGVPMEIQIRTSCMHQDAEYGKAAHWAYKEGPSSAVTTSGGASTSSSEGGPASIQPGHPILQIMPGGHWRDGVVVRSEHAGLRLLVAVARRRRLQASGLTHAAAAEYQRLMEAVEAKGYDSAGQGDSMVSMELYTLCSDRKYHRLDVFGHKHPTTVVPLQPLPAAQGEVEVARPGGGADAEAEFLSERTRLLRSMLEWGRDLNGGDSASVDGVSAAGSSSLASAAPLAADDEPSTSAAPAAGGTRQPKDVMVLVWPGGRIEQFPRGTTAGTVVRRLGRIEIQQPSAAVAAAANGGRSTRGRAGPAPASRDLVNVNNRLVPADTPLSDGDLVVLSRELLKI
eukprot:scaffold12.g8297.t1